MTKTAAILALSLALGAAMPAAASINNIDNVPSATLLLPHFEVDPVNATGVNTRMSVGNSSPVERLAHFTLWTDRGVPTRTFDLRLPGYGIADVDLRAVFNGTLPASTAGGFATCAATLPPAALTAPQITDLRNAHTGLASGQFGGQCGGVAYGDGIARGYITVDVVASCSTAVPGDAGYFIDGGTGIARNDNVLWGEYAVSIPASGVAYGDTLVHIQADAAHVLTDGTPTMIPGPGPMDPPTFINDYTFYGRRVGGTGADNREALPQQWMGRYSFQDAIAQTTTIVWRDVGVVTSFACGAPPAALPQRDVVAFDHQENVTVATAAQLPYASQSIELHDPGAASIPYTRGTVLYDLGLRTSAAPFETRNQGHVSHVYGSVFGGEGMTQAWPIRAIHENFNLGFVQECGDGVDNDADGLIDFPADPGCLTADDFSEVKACSDGTDNDGDLLTDFPNDPQCAYAGDATEDSIVQCQDGIDNDADGVTDFPADPNCFGPTDNVEAPGVCSDGVDNDSDGVTDFPADPGCLSANDNDETNTICADGIDNDTDGLTDFPADPGCASAGSNNEAPQCNDGISNDADGLVDFPADPGCASASSNNEAPACNDGANNDGDALVDFPADPGCASASANNEGPQCDDGFDNDGDLLVDHPADTGCTSRSDTSEINASVCNDGVDNDGDGLIDFPLETGCAALNDFSEGPDCSDLEDNDLDALADFGTDPGCASATDLNELVGTTTRQCSDGVDNDGNGLTDYPADAACTSAYDDVEFTLPIKAPTIDVLPDVLTSPITGGLPYLQLITATNGVAPYTFAVTAGTLPPGLTLAADGTLSGTPTAGGTFNFTVTATDDNGFTGFQAYTLQVVAPLITVLPAGPALPDGVVATPYSQVFTASGGTGPYTFAVTAGSPPVGLTLSSGGVLSGTPSSNGPHSFTVTATDANGFTGSTSYTLVIAGGAVVFRPEVIPSQSWWSLLLLATLLTAMTGLALRRD